MANRKTLVLFLCVVLIATGLFITMTGPLAINGLSTMVRNQFGAGPTDADYAPALTIAETGKVERYRMRITVHSEGSAQRPHQATVEGAYIVKPAAEVVTVNYEEAGAVQSITMTSVDGLHYMQEGDIVMQTPDAAVNIQELTLVAPHDATDLSNSFVLIGEEEANGRTTIHYQGDPKALHTDGTIDLSQLETATVDVWVDTMENFIVAMELRAYGVDGNPDGMYEMRLDYFDFNSPDIVITAPEISSVQQ